MKIVPLDEIPTGDYHTPKDNLMLLYSTAKRMEELCNSKGGIGLAAAQVGLPWNLFVYWSNYPEIPKNFSYMVDCEYYSSGDQFLSIEGCLSLGQKRFQLERYESILVEGKELVIKDDSLVLQDLKKEFKDTSAVVIQHEIDHKYGREKMIDVIGKRIYLS